MNTVILSENIDGIKVIQEKKSLLIINISKCINNEERELIHSIMKEEGMFILKTEDAFFESNKKIILSNCNDYGNIIFLKKKGIIICDNAENKKNLEKILSILEPIDDIYRLRKEMHKGSTIDVNVNYVELEEPFVFITHDREYYKAINSYLRINNIDCKKIEIL